MAIDKIVLTGKPKELEQPQEPEKPKDPPKEIKPEKPKPKPKETKPKRRPRKDKGQTHEKIILGTTTAPPADKQKWSTSMKVGFTLGTLTVFAVAFYAMYKALETYRKNKKKLQEEEFIEDEQGEEFIEEEEPETEKSDNE